MRTAFFKFISGLALPTLFTIVDQCDYGYSIESLIHHDFFPAFKRSRSFTLNFISNIKAESIIERAAEIRYCGGVVGTSTLPTQFLCLLLKLLQLQPEISIVKAFIESYDFKYLRLLGAFYLRLVGTPVEIHSNIEPLLSDYRKVRFINQTREMKIEHIDVFANNLLTQERYFSITLPVMQKRQALEEAGQLKPRVSPLDAKIEEYQVSSSESE